MKTNRTFYIGLGCLFSTLCWTIATWAAPNEPEDITFELARPIELADGSKVKSITRANIEALRDQSILLWKGIQDEGVELINDKDENIHVHTCREYDDALEKGYFPSSNAAIMDAAWLKYPCGTLRLLNQAVKPKRSFLPPPEELFDLKLVPLMLFPILSDFEQTYGYDITNETYQDRMDKGLLKVVELGERQSRVDVGYTDDGMDQFLTQVVRTDFNGDGIEDVLLYEAAYAVGGSHRAYDLIILTRKSADSKFVIIFQDDSTDIDTP